MFLGKPIIAYSIQAALESNLFDEVMVSTDDDEIAKIINLESFEKEYLQYINTDEVSEWNNQENESYWNIDSLEENEKKVYDSLYKWLWHISKKMQERLSENPEIVKIVLDNSRKYWVDYRLIFAIISQESAFKPTAWSTAWARGYMQLMPGTARWLWVNINDPEWNIEWWIKYFSQQMKNNNNNIKLALASYNAWPWNVRKYWGVPPFNETRNYVKIIPQRYSILKRYM